MILPFLTSLGALLFEFSVSQFLSLAVGSSAFGFPFVVGSFLLAMGVGAWLAERISPERSRQWLVGAELALALLCLVTLPLLAWTTGATKSWVAGIGDCRALLCSGMGVFLATETLLVLFAVGLLVGLEIPLFTRLIGQPVGRILAADYLGAFAAGVLFPLVLLPRAGLLGTLLAAGLCHLVVAFALRTRALGVPLVVTAFLLLAGVWRAEALERWLVARLVARADASRSEVTDYFRTRKQTVLMTRDELPGRGEDRRLYLDGFLQYSSAWNEASYHHAMVLPARKALGASTADVLILGGGDGHAARVAAREYPGDRVRIVDHDCELMSRLGRVDAPGVDAFCADAFWYLKLPENREAWDLVLVDFPHGVGDAASTRVESYEFFRQLRAVLRPGGIAVLQHESYGSAAHACVEETLAAAGYRVDRVPVDRGGEVMILGRRDSPARAPGFGHQTFLTPHCFALRPWGVLWLGS